MRSRLSSENKALIGRSWGKLRLKSVLAAARLLPLGYLGFCTMKVVHCSRCGLFLGQNDLRYIVSVHVTLDVDGCEGTAGAEKMGSRQSISFTSCPVGASNT